MKSLIELRKLLHLVVLVAVLSGCGTLGDAEPTIDVIEVQTSVFLTMQADCNPCRSALTPAPVFTIESTSTDVPVAEYAQVVASHFQTLQVAFVEFY